VEEIPQPNTSIETKIDLEGSKIETMPAVTLPPSKSAINPLARRSQARKNYVNDEQGRNELDRGN
ncbi:hypothetical protein A2U01_0056610, partial [Trifolium medium]|nr:hypothetical protein [Trifolium medium]